MAADSWGHRCSAPGLVEFGHLGWTYRDRSQFCARAAEYIADGLYQNERIEYVGDGHPEVLQAELRAMRGVRGRLGSHGDVVPTPVQDFYVFLPDSDVVDAEAAAAGYVAAAEQAVADGYSGYRSVVDVTAVARTPEQRTALARCEYLLDQQMAMLPASALCAYNKSQLGAAAAELICLHSLVDRGSVMFRLYAEPDVGFALAGEVDASNTELFATTLQRIWSLAAHDNLLLIDATGLKFITHEQLCWLDQYARADDRQVVLYTDQPAPLRIAGLLDLTNVRLEAHVNRPPNDSCDSGRRDRAGFARRRPGAAMLDTHDER